MKNKIAGISRQIIPILKQYRVKKAGIFGSFARGENSDTSDIDIMIDAPKTLSLLSLVGLQQHLEDVLRRKVDLVEYGLLKPRIKQHALAEEIRIL